LATLFSTRLPFFLLMLEDTDLAGWLAVLLRLVDTCASSSSSSSNV
jgi:hypothetical protein